MEKTCKQTSRDHVWLARYFEKLLRRVAKSKAWWRGGLETAIFEDSADLLGEMATIIEGYRNAER